MINKELMGYLMELQKYQPEWEFGDVNFPKNIDISPTVTFPREYVLRWRIHFEILNECLAHIVGVEPRELSVLDLMRYLYGKDKENPNEA